jgi:hypothetical protein
MHFIKIWLKYCTFDVQDYQPTIVFINVNIRIRKSQRKNTINVYIKVYDANPDSLDIIEIPGFLDVEEGDLTHFRQYV